MDETFNRQAAADRIETLKQLHADYSAEYRARLAAGETGTKETNELHAAIMAAHLEAERLTTLLLPAVYCNQRYYTDVEPFEVVRIISPRLLVVREMKATPQDPAEREPNAWNYESDEQGKTYRVRLCKDGAYYCRECSGTAFLLSDQPRKYVDYGF